MARKHRNAALRGLGVALAITALITSCAAPAPRTTAGPPSGPVAAGHPSTPSAMAATPTSTRTVEPITPRSTSARATPSRVNDIDGDGRVDIVWSGYTTAGEFRIEVAYGDGRVQSISAADVGERVDPGSATSLGGALVVADLNRDGYADVVATDPLITVDGNDVTTIWALWGGAGGLSAQAATLLATAPALTSRLAFVPLPEPVLALATEEDRSGSVRLYPVLSDGSLGQHRLITLDTPGIAGAPDLTGGNHFGQAMAASASLLVIGDGNNGRKEAGAVWVLQMLPGLAFKGTRVSQDSPGMPEQDESGDEYGASVSILGDRVVVGVPGEDWKGQEDAGAVASFQIRLVNGVPRAYNGSQVSQDSPGVLGSAKEYNGFGWHVQAILPCTGAIGALVYTISDSGVGDEVTYGTISSIVFGTSRNCPPRLLATWVEGGRQPLTVARTNPLGSPGELPAVGQRNVHQLGLGWPDARKLIDLVDDRDAVSIDLLAAPTA